MTDRSSQSSLAARPFDAAGPASILLAFDTSTESGSVAVFRGGALVSERHRHDASTHATWLMGAVQEALSDAGLGVRDVGAVALGVGPGSFTGLRIGVSTAKALAWALSVGVKGVSSLEALAMNLAGSGKTVCAMFDARKGMVYSAVFRDEGVRMRRLRPDAELTPVDAVRSALEIAGSSGELIFTGNGVRPSERAVRECGGAVAPAELWHARASNVALLALSMNDVPWLDPLELTPLYLRRSEAELKSRPTQPTLP